MIACQGLTKAFDDNVAVNALTLEIAEGEVFGFLGPNGAGKTTTVRLLTGLIGPSAGTARVAGYELGRENQAIRRNVGILTEAPGMYDRLSAHRNLMIYASLYEVTQPAPQVEKYLRLLGLWDRRDDPAGTFSKGMRQKLAIARALLHEPRVLFLDEPTAGLDPAASRLVREFIEELRGAGRTIFLTTHNLDEADRLCDRVALFSRTLRVVDTPAALRQSLYGNRLEVTLAAPAAPYLDQVSALPFVRSSHADGARLLLDVDRPAENNPALLRALVTAGAPVVYVTEQTHSLEDVYMQLIAQTEPTA